VTERVVASRPRCSYATHGVTWQVERSPVNTLAGALSGGGFPMACEGLRAAARAAP
jgi:hypothetical protein